MRICLAPLSSLTFYAALVLEHLGHDVIVADDMGRCTGVLEGLQPLPPRLRLIDAPPGSKPLRRLLSRCDAAILAWDPWDAGGCSGWLEALTGYATALIESRVERVIATIPAGAYAWSSERVECGSLPRAPPPPLVYRAPLSAALIAGVGSSSLLVVHPPLLHIEERVLPGRPEPINWVEELLETRVLRAPREARLSVLDYRDAAETIALLSESDAVGWYCIGGVTLDASKLEGLAERLSWVERSPSTLVAEGPGVKRRTERLLAKLQRYAHE